MRVLCFCLGSARNVLAVPTDSKVLLVDLPPGKHSPELWLTAGPGEEVSRRVYWVLHPDEPLPCTATLIGRAMSLSSSESEPLAVLHVYEEGG